MANSLKDKDFLRKLDTRNLKYHYVKIIVLDKNELPISTIQGQCSGGSINVNNNSPMRRTGNITFVTEEKYNNLEDVENLLSINKKVKIYIGLENHIDKRYEDIIWFPQGVFIIVDPQISHSNQNGIDITLSFKDKMCLLNGECGGKLPSSVTFHQYDQMQEDGSVVRHKNLIYDIIQTLVHNFGGEPFNKIFINDLEKTIKQLARFTGNEIYKLYDTQMYTLNKPTGNQYDTYYYNDDIGYEYVDLTFPGELISGIGDNVCTVLNKIIDIIGNYEYFYDVEGNFIWQQKRNYLNYSYDGVDTYRLDVYAQNKRPTQRLVNVDTSNMAEYPLAIINETNCQVDFNSSSSSAYTFKQGSSLISSYSNTIQYTNIRNDYHIWGKNKNGAVIHYHLVIKEKPRVMNKYYIKYLKTDDIYNNQIQVSDVPFEGYDEIYTPADWRVELYLAGRVQQNHQERPDIYTQEILDMLPTIYTFREGYENPKWDYKWTVVNNPNSLCYWIDYLTPANQMLNYSVDAIGPKIETLQQDKINKIYTVIPPDYLLLYPGTDIDHGCFDPERHLDPVTHIPQKLYDYSRYRASIEGQAEYILNNAEAYDIYNNIVPQTVGWSAQEYARQLLYEHTDYNAAITINTQPIYYLEPNTTITVQDESSNIYGDYVINSLTIPLGIDQEMQISATRALKRI